MRPLVKSIEIYLQKIKEIKYLQWNRARDTDRLVNIKWEKMFIIL